MDEQELQPLEGEEAGVWTTVYVAEVCRASDEHAQCRVLRAANLAEEATQAFRERMAVGRGSMVLGQPSAPASP